MTVIQVAGVVATLSLAALAIYMTVAASVLRRMLSAERKVNRERESKLVAAVLIGKPEKRHAEILRELDKLLANKSESPRSRP